MKSHRDRDELIDKLETISGVRARIGSPTALSWRLLAACYERRRYAIILHRLGAFYRWKQRSIRGKPARVKAPKVIASDIGVSGADSPETAPRRHSRVGV